MKKAVVIFAILVMSVTAGCNTTVPSRTLLTVDFQKDQSLRYEFTSKRLIDVDWKDGKTKKYHESLKMIIAYTPVEIDPYGLTVIRATCESVEVRRSQHGGDSVDKRDALRSIRGKSFTFTIDATGKITDHTEIKELIRQAGQRAFRQKSKRGRIKEPDMISDFFATQWFLWDSISSIDISQAVDGMSPAQSWQSQMSVPVPMVMKEARDVTYTLDEIRETDKGRVAVIKSAYSSAESAPKSWPMPYPDGRFRMSGTFGFLSGYKMLELKGQGEELFNIDTGRIEQSEQNYNVQIRSSVWMAPSMKPMISIDQKLTMKLLDVGTEKPEKKS